MNSTTYIQDVGKTVIAVEGYIVHGTNVLLHKRSATKKVFPGWWIGPGGHVDSNEDTLSAAIREVKEETGVDITEKDIQLKSIALHHHTDRKEVYVIFIFRAEISIEQNVQFPNQEGESKWIPITDAMQMDHIFPASKYYFDHVLQNKDGILYTNMEIANSNITKIVSSKVDLNK